MTFADLSQRAAKFAIDNSPTILTTIGVVGLGTTAYLTGKASYEAAQLIALKEGVEGVIDDPKERMKERIQLVWKLYIPAMATGAATAACVIGANRVGVRRAASLAAAYSIAEKATTEYRSKVIEKIGERKEEEVRAAVSQDRVNKHPNDLDEVYGEPKGQKCYDKYSDRFVWNTREGLQAAVNNLNRIVLEQGYATVADLYCILDMPALPWSYEFGWSASDKLLELRFSAVLSTSGEPVIAFEFDMEPVRNYRRFH